jgi:pimeloyl-ACP methyl ester carboxylesterase
VILSALSLLAVQPGCASWIAKRIVIAPNHRSWEPLPPEPIPPKLNGLHSPEILRLQVGPPPATLSVLVAQGAGSPRGTILVLHGWHKKKEDRIKLSLPLLAAGFRVVLVDLRGHGSSTGRWLTYGVVESADLSQVIDQLESRGAIAGRLGVFGISYGAGIAIQAAAADPRICAAVAVSPFSSLRSVFPRSVRLFVPFYGWFLSDEGADGILERAGEMARVDLWEASPLKAISRAGTPLLLIHGAKDLLIPPQHSRMLVQAAKERAALVLLQGIGHNSIHRDPAGEVSRLSLDWFTRWL